jgi:hypothetical protein
VVYCGDIGGIRPRFIWAEPWLVFFTPISVAEVTLEEFSELLARASQAVEARESASAMLTVFRFFGHFPIAPDEVLDFAMRRMEGDQELIREESEIMSFLVTAVPKMVDAIRAMIDRWLGM